jgi:hypothetical protein
MHGTDENCDSYIRTLGAGNEIAFRILAKIVEEESVHSNG